MKWLSTLNPDIISRSFTASPGRFRVLVNPASLWLAPVVPLRQCWRCESVGGWRYLENCDTTIAYGKYKSQSAFHNSKSFVESFDILDKHHKSISENFKFTCEINYILKVFLYREIEKINIHNRPFVFL